MQNLLKELGINKIISIDDSWNPENKFLNSNPKRHIKNMTEYDDSEQDLIYESSTLRELKAENKELFYKILKDKLFKDTNLEKLEKIFKDKLSYYSSIDEFRGITIENKDELILFIIDIDMGENQENSLLNLLDEIEKKELNFIVIVYSSSSILESDLSTDEKKKEFLKIHDYEIRYMALINPIKKGISNIEIELKKTITKSNLYTKLHKFIEHKKKIDEKVYETIYYSELHEFCEKVIKTLGEGEGVTDLIRKLFSYGYNEFSFDNQEYIKARENLIAAGNEFYELNKKLKEELTKIKTYSIIDESINKYFKDIYSGDLFVFDISETEKKYGMIVSKSCDMIIRKGGGGHKRKIKNGKVMMLMFNEEIVSLVAKEDADKTKKELEKDLEKTINNLSENVLKGQALWPIEIIDTTTSKAIVNKKTEIEYIDDFILDLCSLNKEGESILKKSFDEAMKYKSYFSKAYFKEFNINKKIECSVKTEIVNLFSDILTKEELETKNNEIFKILLNDKIKENQVIKYNILENGDLKFNIKRLGRVSEDKALLLYQKCLFDLSQRGIDGMS